MTTKQLAIRAIGGVCDRGLFLEESVKAGAVLASIPYKMCMNRELLGTNSRILPSAPLLGVALTKARLNPYGAEHLWLASYLATVKAQPNTTTVMAPYLSLLPSMLSMELQRRTAKESLATSERQEVDEIEAVSRRHVSLTTRFAHRYAVLQRKQRRQPSTTPRPTKKDFKSFLSLLSEANVAQGHDLIMSRSIALPSDSRLRSVCGASPVTDTS